MRSACALLLSAALVGGCSSLPPAEQAEMVFIGVGRSTRHYAELALEGLPQAVGPAIGVNTGSLGIAGQVTEGDAGATDFHLRASMSHFFTDWIMIRHHGETDVYFDTSREEPLRLELSFSDLQGGPFSGTIAGPVWMTGEASGFAEVDIALTGTLEADAVGRVHVGWNSIQVSGTATTDGVTHVAD